MPSDHIQVELHGRILVIQFVSPQLFEYLVLNEVDSQLREAFQEYSPLHVVFDFEQVEFCSSAIINAMLKLRRKVDRLGGKVVLCSVQENIDRAFRVLNLTGGIFGRCPTKQSAIEFLRSIADEDDTASD